MPRAITVGCGAWGFHHLPFAAHFPLAAKLGFRCLEIGLGGGLPGRLPPRVDDALVAEVARLRQEHGLSTPFCCIENDLTLPDPQAHAAMVEEVGFNYDPGNIKAADPGDRRLALNLLERRIVYCHLKDWMPRGSGWVPGAPGDGDLDYAALIPEMSYDGVYLVEYEPTDDVEDGIRRSLAYLDGIVTTR